MTVVLEVVAPVFAIIALGYIAAQRRMVSEEGFRGLSGFVFALASPALLFAGGTAGGAAAAGGAAVAFFLGSLVLFGGALWLGGAVFRQGFGEAGLFALNASFGNTVMMGIPLILAAFGQAGLTVLLGILALHSMVLLGLATAIAEVGLHASAPWRRVLRATTMAMLRNPIVMSVALAMVWNALGLPVPAVVRRTLEMLGAAGPPVALFCLGGSLVGLSAAAAWRETVATGTLKLLVMPALVWACCIALGLGQLETAVAVTTAALPTGANAFILARRYRIGAERSGAAVLVTTLISVATLAGLIGFFRGEG